MVSKLKELGEQIDIAYVRLPEWLQDYIAYLIVLTLVTIIIGLSALSIFLLGNHHYIMAAILFLIIMPGIFCWLCWIWR